MDRAFKGLYFKEWKMMKGFFITQYVIAILWIIFINGFGANDIIGNLIGLTGLGFIILPAYMLFSLNTEVNQMELFLHNPQSVHKLLLVKLVNGIFFALSYLLVLAVTTMGLNGLFNITGSTGSELLAFFSYCIVLMLIVAIYPTVIIIFFWTLHQIWKTYIRGLSIIAVIGVLIIGSQIMQLFARTDIYHTLTNWGVVSFSLKGNFFMPFILGSHEGNITTIVIGTFVFYGVIVMLLYLLSAYLIDHKVEV